MEIQTENNQPQHIAGQHNNIQPAAPEGFSGMGEPGGMQSPGGSFSGMNGMNSFNAMSFAMNMR